MASVPSRKEHIQWSDVVRSPDFLWQLQIIASDDPGKLMQAIKKELDVPFLGVPGMHGQGVRGDLGCHSCVMKRGQFVRDKTWGNSLFRSKHLLRKLKRSEEP